MMMIATFHEHWRLSISIPLFGVAFLMLMLPGPSAGDVEECTEEEDSMQSGCDTCLDDEDEGVSYKCTAPHPQDEFCQPSLVDNTGCEESLVGCPNKLIIWTQPGCELGSGTSHTTTTDCSEKIEHEVATDVPTMAECDDP